MMSTHLPRKMHILTKFYGEFLSIHELHEAIHGHGLQTKNVVAFFTYYILNTSPCQ